MEITYHFHNLDSTEALKEHSKKKIEKLSAHFNAFFSAVVRFRVEKIQQYVEFSLQGDGVQFVAEEGATDMYAAVDLLEKKMERMIRRHKEKQLGKHRR